MDFRHRIATRLLAGLSVFSVIQPAQAGAQESGTDPLLPAQADTASETIHFTLPPPNADGLSACYIYANSLRTGLGSSSIRLDRGMLGQEQLLCFRTLGGKIAATFENTSFRASGDAETEKGGRESFAFSIAAMLDIESTEPGGELVVDMAPFLARDVVGIADALGDGGKEFALAPALSAVNTASLKVFPDNIEVDAIQTFTSKEPGREVSAIAPEPRQASFVVHHSFIRLPGPGFQPRLADPRAPVGGPLIYDYGADLGLPVAIELAARFRLEKTDPTAERSAVKKPIIFYIDRAAPEPVRTALMEGVNYWQRSFERAGFIDAFRAELLPEGADPLDVRYNIVNWSNRLTRGWSYGGGIRDPRTGEIIKGNVVIGALRVRQDIAIFEGLVGTAENGTGSANDPVRVSLDRIRQLGAHEVGHAIGFMHNFAGSTQGRTTVMDYPPPRIGLLDGKIDLSDAYEKSGGVWDDYSVDWLYGDPAPGIDPDVYAAGKALAIEEAGVAFMTDIDGRASDLPSPVASMWDDGPDPLAALAHMVAVRDVALANFGDHSLLPGEPRANLRRKFVPIWLLHRYDVEAVGKIVGGLDYEYAVVGDNHPDPAPFPAAMQEAAIESLVALLDWRKLTVPDGLVPLLSVPTTRLPDAQFNTEVLPNAGAAAFDPLAAADVAAQLPLDSLLAPARLTRMLEQHRRDPAIPGPSELVEALGERVIDVRPNPIARRIAYRAILTMAEAAMDPATAPEAAAILGDYLNDFSRRFSSGGRGEDRAWARHVARILKDDKRLAALLAQKDAVPDIPPGMPIGGDSGWFDD
ncbi:MAG TPA: zinc-dependent metalloprotease [Alteraurantiacibacter sp.]